MGVQELGGPRGDAAAAPLALELRPLEPGDWPTVSEIYRDGMSDGLATFETDVPSWDEWGCVHLHTHRLVAEVDGVVAGFAALAPASSRPCYGGVAENSVYVARGLHGRGIGRALLERLIAGAEADGIWTIQTSIFPENRASLALHRRCGFRIVGRRKRIARRDGVWRDTLLFERRSEVVT